MQSPTRFAQDLSRNSFTYPCFQFGGDDAQEQATERA